jgi:hypothetical protein
MWWTYGVPLITTIVGFSLGWRNVKRNRMPFAAKDELLHWTERSVSAWQQDWASALFITVHSLSVIVLSILFLLDVVQGDNNYTLFPFDGTSDGIGQVSSLVVIAALGLVWLLCGSLLAYPLATRLIQPISMSIVSDGVIRGQYFSPWHFYGHFSTEPGHRLIRLYSSRTPEIARVAWQPPTETIDQAVALVGKHLPQRPPALSLPWYRGRTAFLSWLFILTVPLVAVGLLLYVATLSWTWMYYPVATYFIFILGSVIIQKYQVG